MKINYCAIFFHIIDIERYENIQYIAKHFFFKVMLSKKKHPSSIDYDFHQFRNGTSPTNKMIVQNASNMYKKQTIKNALSDYL